MCSESLLTFLEFFERVLDISPEKLGAYKPDQYLSIDKSIPIFIDWLLRDFNT